MWITQSRRGELFDVDQTLVNHHIHNIYKAGELDGVSTYADIALGQVGFAQRSKLSYLHRRKDGPRNHSRASRRNQKIT